MSRRIVLPLLIYVLLNLNCLSPLLRAEAGAAGAAAAGDSSAARIAALEAQVRQLQAEIASIERRLEAAPDAGRAVPPANMVASAGPLPAVATTTPGSGAAAAPSPQIIPSAAPQPAARLQPTPTVSAGPEGFSLQSADKQDRLQIRYQVQVDGRFGVDRQEPSDPNSFFLRRSQPIFSGVLRGRYSYQMLLDFAQGKARINDAYVDVPLGRGVNVRAGKAKGPVGLDRLRSGTGLMLAERGLPTELVPNREIGVQLFGALKHEEISYAVGVFNGVADQGISDGDTNDGKDLQGRIFLQPFRAAIHHPLNGLVVGLGASYGQHDGNSSLSSYTSSGSRSIFAYRHDSSANGTSFRYVPQGYYYHGPFGVMSEYALSSQQVSRGIARATLRNSAWQVAGTYVLTGDNGSFGGVDPRRPFDPSKGDWGAWEIAARYNEMRLDVDAFPVFADAAAAARTARAWALGVNWYLNRNVKLVLTYENTDFDAAEQGAVLKPERVFFERFQFRF